MIGGVSGGFDPSSIFSSKRPDATEISNRIMQKGDENGDGAISKAEFEKTLSQAQAIEKDKDKDKAQQRFDKLDKNSDGSVDQGELQSGIEEKLQMIKDKMAALGISPAMVNMFIGQGDEDEDQNFSPVTSLLDALKGSDPMAKGDADADGALNKEEFNSLLSATGNGKSLDDEKAGKIFDKVDGNSDGKISQSELDNIQERIKASMLMARQSQASLQENQDQLSKLAKAMKEAYTSSIEGLGSSNSKGITESLSESA